MKILKYPIIKANAQYGLFQITMPLKARIVSAIVQESGHIVLYAEVRGESMSSPRAVFIAGTGREVPTEVADIFRFVGTVQQDSYVWHVYAEPAMREDL